MRTLEEIQIIATKLYQKRANTQEWINTIEPIELAKLWHETCVLTKINPEGASWDDEVYKALKQLGYFSG